MYAGALAKEQKNLINQLEAAQSEQLDFPLSRLSGILSS